MTTVTEIASDVYRISTYASGYGMQFNQFLLKDDEPVLIHTWRALQTGCNPSCGRRTRGIDDHVRRIPKIGAIIAPPIRMPRLSDIWR
jgi:hypothetical protein